MSDLFPYGQLPLPTVPDLSDQIGRTNELIGRGGYGSVYKGKWLGAVANATPSTIAIKIIELVPLRDEARRTRRFKQITRELSLWCSIQHENILPLLGIARISGDTNVPAFVCPWMENGNAKEFCSRNPRFPPILILYDIINGLHYLHTFQPEIVHGDIKAVNVLINNRCEACLCDFGLSRFLTDDTLWKTTATHAGGTIRWMAPELINEDATTPTKESDIYAYAMTCYELLSGDVPFKSVSKDITIQIKVMKGQRPDRIKSFHSDFMWDIITRCWEQEPKARLLTEKVLRLLRSGLREQMAEVVAKAEDLKALKEEKEKALAKAEEDLKVSREGKDTALARAEEEMKALRKDQAAAERKKNDMERKYERIVKQLQELREQLERAREGSSLPMEEKIARLEFEVVRLQTILKDRTMALSRAEEAIRHLSVTNHRQHEETIQTNETERLKASLDELSQLLQGKGALESEVSRLHHLLEEKTTALSSTEEAKKMKVYEFEAKITIQTEEIKRLEANLEKLLQEKAAKFSSVERVAEQRIAENQERIAQLESEVAHLNHTLEEKTTALSSTEEAATKRKQLTHDLSATNQLQQEEMRQMKMTRPSTDSEQISTLLLPTIVNKADSISVTEVADLVRILNAQIGQASLLIADSLFYQKSPSTGKELDIVWDELNDYIGSWLCNDLKRRSKELIVEPDPVIIQIVTLQTGLVNACSRIINDRNPPFWIDGLVFSRTCSSIEKTNGQATADAQRALSQTHMTVSQSERQEASKKYLTEVLLKMITAIGGSLENGGILLPQYKEKVDDIVQKAVGLHKVVNEDITSMELVTYTTPSDTPFDASQMEDAEGDEKSRSDRVVCTFEMGLRCRKRDKSGKENGSKEEWDVLIKSKVVLAATLEG